MNTSTTLSLTETQTTATERSFTVRAMLDADWPLVQAGFAHSFWDCHPPSVWNWRYQRHLHQGSREGWRGWLAQEHQRGEVIAWLAAGVHKGWGAGQTQTVLLPSDSFSRPEWRSGGKRSPYVQVETAFHQHQVGHAAISLGFGLDRRMKLAFLSGNALPFSSGQWMQAHIDPNMRHQGSSVMLELTQFEGSQWDALWQQRREKVAWSLVRDQAFLSWRFHPRQGKAYHRIAIKAATSPVPLGYVVLHHRSPTETVWVDSILPTQPEQLRDMWGLLCAWLHRQGMRRFLTYVTPGCPEYALFHGFGWQPCEAPLPVLPGFRLYAPALSVQDIMQQYAFTLGDSDLF
jgi:hypothetical protein